MTDTAADTVDLEYLKVSQVAEHLNVSERHVYTLINTHDLATKNFGTGRKGIRVTAESLAAFVARS